MRWKVEIRENGKDPRIASVEGETWLMVLARVSDNKSIDLGGVTVDFLSDSIRIVTPTQHYLLRESRGIPKSGEPPRPSAKSDADLSAHKNAATKIVSVSAEAPRPTTPGMVAITTTPEIRPASEPILHTAPPASQTTIPVGKPASQAPIPAALPASQTTIPVGKPASQPTVPAAQPASRPSMASVRRVEASRSSARPPALAATLLSRREQDPSAESPIWYRELAYAVPIATDEDVAEAFALRMVEDIARTSPEPGSRFVNIAVFDEIFTGEPTVPPLVIVEWKDWKGAPVVRFPRRMSLTPAPRNQIQSVAPAAARADMFLGPVTSPPKAKRAGVPRLTGDALIAALFDKVHQVSSKRDGIEAGYFCLDMAISKMQMAGGFVHFYDEDRKEFVLACARGGDVSGLLGSRRTEADPFLGNAIRSRAGMLFAGEGRGDHRFNPFGGAGHVALGPIWSNGKFRGVIELVNPPMGTALSTDDATAVTYLAEQLAEFFGSEKPVITISRISQPPPPPDQT